MKRLDQLTFTRFLMILLVLFYHGDGGIYLNFLKQLPFSEIFQAAPTAVSYLYVLSGFVMALVYFRPHEKFDFSGYWRARFIRIYPLYIIAFLLTCYYYLDSILVIKPPKIMANVFVVQAWFPSYAQSFNYASWSMTVEFFFYALFPFFTIWAYKQSTKKLISVAIIFWAVSQIIHHTLWIIFFPENKNIIVYNPVFHLNSFIMGVVGGIWYLREGRTQNIKPITIFSTLSIGTLFILGYLVVSLTYYPVLPHDLQPMAGLLAPLMVLVIISLALDQSRLSLYLNHPWLVNLGETSYAIYILHVPVVWLYQRFLETSTLSVSSLQVFEATTLPILIAIGLVTHFYLDLPLRAWLKKTLRNINIPLLLLDLAILTASVYFSFSLRFDHPREYESYRQIGRLIFYSAFFIRPFVSIIFNTFNPETFRLPLAQLIRSLLISTTVGSALVAVIAYLGFNAGLSVNFPRSIFIIDWLIVFSLSLLVRLLFRLYWLNKPIPNSSEQGMTHV